MDDLGFLPLEHLEKFLDGKEFAVGSGYRDDGHGAARTLPYGMVFCIIRSGPRETCAFALGRQKYPCFAVHLYAARRVTAVEFRQKVFFDVHGVYLPLHFFQFTA